MAASGESSTRYRNFRDWLTQASSQKIVNGYLAVFWLIFGLGGVATPIKNSIPVLFFISVYANFAGHLSAWQACRVEERQEQVEERRVEEEGK